MHSITTLARVVLVVLFYFFAAAPVSAQICATCNAGTSGAPGADTCALWIVQWTQASPGDCKLAQGDCLAGNACNFGVTVSILSTGVCPGPWSFQFCIQFVDAAGNPVGLPFCNPELPLDVGGGPLNVSNIAAACGQKFSLAFSRAGAAFLTISATCTGCPPGGG